MASIWKIATLAALFLQAGLAWAAEPLVDVDWVKANLDSEDTVFIDLRPKPAYLDGHVPGAVHSQYGGKGDQWRMKSGDVRGMLRDPDQIASHLGAIGVSNEDHVVLLPAGSDSADMGVATRVYWTLNYLGHDEVSILDGGMAGYLKEVDDKGNAVNPLDRGEAEVQAAKFVADPRPEMLVTAEDIDAMVAEGAVLVDNRTQDYHLGINKSGAAKAAGTLPGAVNLPYTWVTTDAKGDFRDREALDRLYEAAGLPTDGTQVNFCNTGHLASVGWFVSHELMGIEDAKLFDGSMAEWTHSGRAAERKITP